MTAMVIPPAGASSTASLTWNAINWQQVVTHVRQLQMRIAKAFREKKYGKAKALQWILTHSFYAKLLAVRRVVQNKGAKTPGVDGVVWNTTTQKMQAALSLKRKGYQTKPLRRIYIPKKQKGKLRPLSIPAMECRAQQALHLLSLEPIAEIVADKNAYGFRPLRSTADAIEQCFNALVRKCSAQFILEGDIHSCYDQILHLWLHKNAPMDKRILGKWLAAGYIEKGKFTPTDRGTPQGGLISPTLLNVTLSGLEAAVKAATKCQDKVNIIIYADDFIITADTQTVLEHKVKPAVENFLRERGLSLSQEKTKITHINEGFDFLGINIRKYKGKLIMKPAKSSVKRFLAEIRRTIKQNATAKTEKLLRLLNPKIRGWTNYYRHICSKKTFNYVDMQIFRSLWGWAKRRHPKKGRRWVVNRYFRQSKFRSWVFSARIKHKDRLYADLDLISAGSVPIVRHIKVRADAIPFDSAYHEYFDKRLSGRRSKRPRWWLGWWNLLPTKKRTEKPDHK